MSSISSEIKCGGEAVAQCDKHEWVVFSTALAERWLMLQCVRCRTHGTVDAPTTHEWSEAFRAPSKPYRWQDEGRVTVRGQGATYVVAKQPGTPCECIERGLVNAPDKYERVIGGIMVADIPISDADREDLSELASVALDGGLCSRLLAIFLQGFSEETGIEPSTAARRIARRIEQWDTRGLHMSPGIVAMILRAWAESLTPRHEDDEVQR